MHSIIFFSLIVTIFSALDPNEQYAICRLDRIETKIDCTDPCSAVNRIYCSGENIEKIAFSEFLDMNTTIPIEYGYFSRLKVLDLKFNSLVGTIPSELGNLTSLESLILNDNKLTGTIPKELGNLTTLNILYLYYNDLIGIIPSELGKIISLTQLIFNDNNLSGPIPKEFGNMTSLQYLNLYSNFLSGLIPKELGKLTMLNSLILSTNNFKGSIPEELGNMTSLQYLHLDNNILTGTIPTQLGKLTHLNMLDLSNNQLTGTIPTQILNLVNNGLQLNTSNNPLDMNSPQPSYPNPQPDNSNNSLEVNQTLNLSDGNFVFQTVNISSGSLLLTNDANLTTTTIYLSENSILSITNSTIHVQENITIPTGFILSIINPTTTSLETSGHMNIQPNTTINISLPSNYGDTQSNDLTLISFKYKTGTFSKVNINNECIEFVENNIGFILTQSSERKCTSSTQKTTITICAIVTIFFISLLF